MSDAAKPRWGLAIVGGLALAAAMPGIVPVVGPLLVIPGLMAWYALATAGARPKLASYLFGCVFMAVFSWSLHRVMVAAYGAVVVLGGCYFVLGTMAVRPIVRLRVPAFALAVGATFWLRAYMPEIYYPHGQPCHALYEWPLLLGTVPLGGEALTNAVLAALAASLVELWRGWRLATPSFAIARGQLLATLGLGVVLTAVGHWLRPHREPVTSVVIAALEPGVHPFDPYVGLDAPAARALYRRLLEERLVGPTRALLSEDSELDLVLWPETALPHELLPIESIAAGHAHILVPGGLPRAKARLLLGALVARGPRSTPAALLLELPDGRVLGYNEKRRIVPGGEFLPFARVLPQALAEAMLAAFERAMGSVPDFQAGVAQPLLETAGGHRFGALLCYDNAFPEPAGQMVGDGAQFLVVLSNEAWYRGGAELAQLVAMTVCRALEQGVPIVRCTTDGWSVVVDRGGRLVDQLEPVPSPAQNTRILRLKLPLAAAADGPMPSWRGRFGPLTAIWLGLVILHGFVRWARLRVVRNAA